jgi:inner membrane protein
VRNATLVCIDQYEVPNEVANNSLIIEPFLWAAMAPPLYFAVATRGARIALSIVLLFGIVLCFLRDFVPRSMAISVTGLALVVGVLAYYAEPRRRALLGVAATLAVILTFVTVQRTARAGVLARVAADFPKATTHDLALTPMPANPLCWNAILIQTEGDAYLVRSGVFAAFPAFMNAAECPFNSVISPTAPSRFVEGPARAELRWQRQFSAPRRELVALSQECVASALLRFVRAPYWTSERFGARIVGDVRYDRLPDLDFSDLRIERGAPCPRFVPPWIPPRTELLHAP